MIQLYQLCDLDLVMLGEMLPKQVITAKLGGSSKFIDRDHHDSFFHFPVWALASPRHQIEGTNGF